MYFFLKNEEGTPVAYLRVFYTREEPELSDVETRPGYRQKGYATSILKKVAEFYGLPRLTYNGGYTALGYAAVQHQVDRMDEAIVGEPRVEYSPKEFVKNWDAMEVFQHD